MKTLLLMRHAKSDWNAAFRSDHERPINERGVRAAARVGGWLAAHELVPEQVVCSTATRARQTLDQARRAGNWSCAVRLEESVYEASPMTLVEIVRGLDDQTDSAMLVGHEPGMSMTVAMLLGDAPVRFPTAAVARLDLDAKRWAAVQPGSATLVFFVPPRLLES